MNTQKKITVVLLYSTFLISLIANSQVSPQGATQAQNKTITQPSQPSQKDSSSTTVAPQKGNIPDSVQRLIEKSSTDSLEQLSKSDLEAQQKLQAIFDKMGGEFYYYDSILSVIEIKQSYLEDSLFSQLDKLSEKQEVLKNKIDTTILSFATKEIDPEKKRKGLPAIHTLLENQFNELSVLKTKLNEGERSEKAIEEELKQLDGRAKKSENKHKAEFESIQKYLNTKQPALFQLRHRNINFRILVTPVNTSIIKVDPDLTKSRRSLKPVWDAAKRTKPYGLFNAGMFNEDGSAVGLQIVDGKIINPINLNKGSNFTGNFYMQPNGIFYVDKKDNVGVLATDEFNKTYSPDKFKNINYATQSGPMLVIKGKINAKFGLNSTNRYIRNGIGVAGKPGSQVVVSIISSTPCTFYDLASLYKWLGCESALYLDGAVSVMFTDLNGKKTGDLASGSIGPIIAIYKK
jgi:uncharacterized protein YigE (DUF2233 family)